MTTGETVSEDRIDFKARSNVTQAALEEAVEEAKANAFAGLAAATSTDDGLDAVGEADVFAPESDSEVEVDIDTETTTPVAAASGSRLSAPPPAARSASTPARPVSGSSRPSSATTRPASNPASPTASAPASPPASPPVARSNSVSARSAASRTAQAIARKRTNSNALETLL